MSDCGFENFDLGPLIFDFASRPPSTVYCLLYSVYYFVARRVDRDLFSLARPAVDDLHHAVSHTRPDVDPERHPDKVGIFELDPRALVTVIEQNIGAFRDQLGVDLFTGLKPAPGREYR